MHRRLRAGQVFAPVPNILKACLQEVFELYEQKKIDPVVDSVFDVQQIALAHDRLESRLSIGKVAVKW